MFTITYALERVCIEHILWFQRCQFCFLLPWPSLQEGMGGAGAAWPWHPGRRMLAKSQLSGSSVLSTEWQIGTLLTMSVQSALLSIFQETSVCNSCTKSSGGLWVTPCHPKCQAMRAHLRDSQVGKLLPLTAWHLPDGFNQGPSTKASGRLELLLERLERA